MKPAKCLMGTSKGGYTFMALLFCNAWQLQPAGKSRRSVHKYLPIRVF
jgi:hypothetical protein